MLKTLLITLFAITTLSVFAQIEKDHARALQVKGKPVFISCTPLGEFTRSKNFRMLMHRNNLNHIVNRAYRKAKRKTRTFDALLIEGSGRYGTAILFTRSEAGPTGNDLAKANTSRSKIVFIFSEPLAPYEVVGKIRTRKVVFRDMTETMSTIALNKAFKKGFDFDALIVTGKARTNGIRFVQQ